MIVPDGMILRLDPRDEYTHTPEPVPNYNESMYFNAFDPGRGYGLWLRLGNRVNEGHAEMTVCLYLPDGRVAFMFRRAEITDNSKMSAGGLTIEVIQPFEKLSVRYEGEILLMEDASQMLDPAKAFKSNPKRSCAIALEVTGVSPMHGGEIVNPDGTPWELDPETAVFRGHTEQHTRVAGTVTVDGVSLPLEGYGFRDKSWGPRHWQSFYWYKWIPLTFSDRFGVLLSYMGQPGGPPVITGHIFQEGRLEPVTDAAVEAVYNARDFQTGLTARLQTRERTYVVTGEALSVVPLRHRRQLADGSETHARITEGMMRYTCGPHTGLGMSEFFDLIVAGRPMTVDPA